MCEKEEIWDGGRGGLLEKNIKAGLPQHTATLPKFDAIPRPLDLEPSPIGPCAPPQQPAELVIGAHPYCKLAPVLPQLPWQNLAGESTGGSTGCWISPEASRS